MPFLQMVKGFTHRHAACKHLLLLCIVLCSLHALPENCPAEETNDSDAGPGPQAITTITLACPKETHPFYFIDRDGHPKGWHLDFWQLWSQKTGIRTECRSGAWKELFDDLRNGTVDAHAGLFYSEDRDEFLDYSNAVTSLHINFFYHKQILGLNTLNDLRGFRIGVVENTFLDAFLQKRLPDASLVRFLSFAELLDALERKDVRIFVAEESNALWHLNARGLREQFMFNPASPLFTQPLFAAVPEGNRELLDLINQGMQQISPNERAEIEKKWFGDSSAQSKDTLELTLYQNFSPYSFLNADGEVAGMLVDIWRLWAQKTGRTIHFRVRDWQETLDALQHEEADIHTGLAFTEERAAWLDYSQPFCEISVDIFYARVQGAISTFDALKGQPVGLIRGMYQESSLRRDYPEIRFLAFDSVEEMIFAAKDGKIRAFLSETLMADTNLYRLGLADEFGNAQKQMFTRRLHGAVLKGRPELLALVDKGFNHISHQELIEIEQRWLAGPAKRYSSSVIPQLRFTAAEQAWLQAGHHVRVWGIDWPPYLFMNETVRGIAKDYFDRIGDKTGVDFSFVWGSSFGEAIEEMQQRNYARYDAIFAVMRSPEREKFLEFSQDYLTPPWAIFTRTDSNFISGIQDLIGKTIVVPRQFIIHDLLARDYPHVKLLEVNTVQEALEALATGRADAYIENLVVASYLIQQQGYSNIKVAAPTPFGNHTHAIAVRDDWPELASILDKALSSMTKDEHAAIQNRWLKVRYEHGLRQRDIWRWVLQVLGGAMLILLLFLLRNRRLRQEILERTRVEEALRNSEAQYRLLAENSSDVISTLDTDLHFSYVSPSVERLTGYTPEEMLALSLEEVFTPSSLEKVMANHTQRLERHVQTLEKSSDPIRTELEHYRKDGSLFWAEDISSSLLGKSGEIVGFLVTTRDISERKEAENKLIAIKTELEHLLAHSPAIIYSYNHKAQRLSFVSENIRQVLGYSPQDFQRLGIQFIHPNDLQRIYQERARLFIERYLELEYRIYHRDGHILWIRDCMKLIDDKDGAPLESVGYLIDITERKQAEHELKESEQALQELVYIASHDLQTPIVSMVGYATNILTRHAQHLDEKGVYAVQRTASQCQTLAYAGLESPGSFPAEHCQTSLSVCRVRRHRPGYSIGSRVNAGRNTRTRSD